METNILNMSIIANNIRRLRLLANLTQTELAKKLHVSTSSIYAWEKEKSYPSLKNILSLCNYFDVKVDNLIGVPSMINR